MWRSTSIGDGITDAKQSKQRWYVAKNELFACEKGERYPSALGGITLRHETLSSERRAEIIDLSTVGTPSGLAHFFRFFHILWMQLKFDVNFCNSQSTPYDAINDAQHLYHHWIWVYPTIKIVTRPVFDALSIALGGGWWYWACSNVSDVLSTSSFSSSISAHHGEDVGSEWQNSWMMPCHVIPGSNTLLDGGLAQRSCDNIGGWSSTRYIRRDVKYPTNAPPQRCTTHL